MPDAILHGELRTRLFPPLTLDVTPEQIGSALGDFLQGQIEGLVPEGGEATTGARQRKLLFPRLSAWLLQPRIIIETPVGSLDQAPEGDPGEQWKLALPLLGLLVVGGFLWLLHAITK